jgi:hypothetical protein
MHARAALLALPRAARLLPHRHLHAAASPCRAGARRMACAAAAAGDPPPPPPPPARVAELRVNELAELLAAGVPLQCIDVREQWEFDTAALPNFALRPLSSLSVWCALRLRRVPAPMRQHSCPPRVHARALSRWRAAL